MLWGVTDCFLLDLMSALQEESHAWDCKSGQESIVQELGALVVNLLLLLLCEMDIVSERSFFLQWMVVVNVVITSQSAEIKCLHCAQSQDIYITTPLLRLRDDPEMERGKDR